MTGGYRDKILGLMAINLTLLAVNVKIRRLQRYDETYSDCLGVLNRMVKLPDKIEPAGGKILILRILNLCSGGELIGHNNFKVL